MDSEDIRDLPFEQQQKAYQDYTVQLEADIEWAHLEKLRRLDLNYKPRIITSKQARRAVEADYESRYSKYLPQTLREETALKLSPLIKALMNFGTNREVIKEVRSFADCSSASATAMRSWFERLRKEWLLTPPSLPREAAGLVWKAFYLRTPIPSLTKDFIVGFLNFYKLPPEGPFFSGQPPIYSMPFSIAQHFEKATTTDVHAALDAGAMKRKSNALEEVKPQNLDESNSTTAEMEIKRLNEVIKNLVKDKESLKKKKKRKKN